MATRDTAAANFSAAGKAVVGDVMGGDEDDDRKDVVARRADDVASLVADLCDPDAGNLPLPVLLDDDMLKSCGFFFSLVALRGVLVGR